MLEDLRAEQDGLARQLTTTQGAAKSCGEVDLAARAEEQQQALLDQVFRIALVGEFKAGKSTLANALLGRDLLPTAARECSPAIARIRALAPGELPGADIRMTDGTHRQVSLDALDELLRLPIRPDAAANGVVEAVIRVAGCAILQDGVELVDTPGVFAAGLARERATLEFLPRADAIVFLTRADQPLPESEVQFLSERIPAGERARLFLVVNRADEIRSEPERAEVLKRIHTELAQFGSLRLHFLSAADAVDAIEDGDDEALRRSGVPEFLDAVTTFLSKERAASLLAVQRTRAESLRAQLVRRLLARLRNSELDDEMALRRRQRLSEMIRYTRSDGAELVAELQHSFSTKFLPALGDQVDREIRSFEGALRPSPEGESLQQGQATALAERHGGRALTALQGVLRDQLGQLRGHAAERLQLLFNTTDAELGGANAPTVEANLSFDDLVVIRTERLVSRPAISTSAGAEAAPVGATLGAALGAMIFGPLGAVAGAALGAWLVTNQEVREVSATFVGEVRNRRSVDVKTSVARLQHQLETASTTAADLASTQLLRDVRAIVMSRVRELDKAVQELDGGGLEPSMRPKLEAALLELGHGARRSLPAP
jgi:predicted GTPase